ncbi:MAG: hypothetical protein NUV91_01200 [Candidatus Omnitrophica bacterium]|nr:hypothetical protein [Candidatus Omnitrophota bacterium]
MKFFNLKEAPQNHGGILFYYSPGKMILGCVTLVLFTLMIFYIIFPQNAGIAYWVGGVLVFILLCMSGELKARFRPTNWLIKFDEQQLMIKFRSYLNYHFDPLEIQIFSIPLKNIEFCRSLIEKIETPSYQQRKRLKVNHYIQFQIKPMVDLSELKKYLQNEKMKKAPSGRWNRTKHLHFPVCVDDQSIIVDWQGVSPLIKESLKIFAQNIKIKDQMIKDLSYHSLNDLTKEEINKRVQKLVRQGDQMGAIRLARRALRLNIHEAKEHIEKLNK